MRKQQIQVKNKAKMIVYLLLVLAVISGVVLGARVLPSISFGAEDTQKLLVEANLEKYINYNISDQDKGTLVQYNVKEKIENGENYIPVKNSEVVAKLSKIDGKYPYAVTTITKSTALTNGKTSGIEENASYDASTGTVTLKANNQNEQGELIYKDQPSENSADEYIILCYYDTYAEVNPERNLDITVSAKSTLSIEDNAIIDTNSKFEAQVAQNIGTLTSIHYQTEDIYNGYIKSNKINETDYNTQYKQLEQILVAKKEAQEKLEILENNTFVVGEQNIDLGNNHNLVYKSTKISKENLVKLLGEEGVLEILDTDKNVIATINKDTTFDENGTITINYENDPEAIIIRTSKVQKEGILSVEHTKEIKSGVTDVTDTKIKTITQITGTKKEVVKNQAKSDKANEVQTTEETIEKQIYTDNHENIVGFQEAKTNVNISVNNTEWTNKQQNDVTFDVSLNANTIRDNMFRNPTIRIELPNQVEKVILQNSGIFYENELTLQEPYTETNENGNIVIVANLTGAQTSYSGNALELSTDVRISATIILKKDIETTSANANLVYTNQYTTDASVETGSKGLALQIESYQEEQVAPVEEENATYSLAKATQANVDGLKLEVAPIKGDTNINNSDAVYEGEYIKYNVKITNTSDEDMNDVKIVGGVPEGTTYGELIADYNTSVGKYEYKFEEATRAKEIQIGTLKAGESITKFYEVQVNDLAEEENEKQITTAIKAYVGEAQAANYEIKNVVKPANAKVFLGAFLGNLKNHWTYNLCVTSDKTEEVTVKVKMPKEFSLDYILIDGKGEGEGLKLDLDKIASVSEDNVITAKIKTNKNYLIAGYINRLKSTKETENSELELTAVANVELNNSIYSSNENRIVYGYDSASISMTSDNEGEEVRYEDEINYEIKVTNTGKTNLKNESYSSISVNVTDFLPEDVEIVSIAYDNWEEEKASVNEENGSYTATGKYNKIETLTENVGVLTDEQENRLPDADLYLTIPYGETATIKVKTTAGMVYEKTKVENSATVTGEDITAKTSNIVTHTILPYDYEENEEPQQPVDPSDPNVPVDPNAPVDPSNPSKPSEENEKYSISGVAWLDENEDGQRQNNEKLLSGITVMVVDAKDATMVKGEVKTNEDGSYRFADLPKGDYVVLFQYDTNTYRVTEYQKNGVTSNSNSDAITKEISVKGTTMKVGIIDVTNLEASVSNMDIGLVENKICDFKLDKSITKVTVTTNTGTKQYAYNNEKLAKVEIRAKEIEKAIVIIEYKIVVTNEGELPSTVGKVIDYLPEGLTFSSELNKNWSAGANGQLINTSISNQKIKAGESVELTLIATKTMTSSNTGTFTNAAEIGDITNSLGITDKDSTPGNKVKTEDDYSEASVIISVSTGILVYISIGMLIAILIGAAVFIAHKHGILKIGKTSLFAIILAMVLVSGTNVAEALDTSKKAYFTYDHAQTGGPNGNAFNAYGSRYFYGDEKTTGDALCINPGVSAYDGYYNFLKWETIKTETSTKTDDISINMKKLNDDIEMKTQETNYIYGPFKFNCSYDGGYKLTIKDGKGKKITDYQICDATGKNKTLSGTGDITFYLKISADSCKNCISSVGIQTTRKGNKEKTTTKWAKALYRAEVSNMQDVETIPIFKKDETKKKEPISNTKSIIWKNVRGYLDIIKQDADNHNIKLKDVKITVECPTIGYSKTVTTNEVGEAHLENLQTKKDGKKLKYSITEIETPNYGYKPDATAKVTIGSGQKLTYTLDNTKYTGNLFIEKKDKETGAPLEGIGFKIKNAEGKYIIAKVDGKEQTKTIGTIYLSDISYTSEESKATEFITDSNGKIAIYNILAGNYKVIETSVGENSNGYEIDDDYITWEINGQSGKGKEASVTVIRQKSTDTAQNSTSTKGVTFTMNNERKYIRLSGYVWLDMIDAKTSERTHLYKDTETISAITNEKLPDENDLLVNGITVRLKDRTTGEVKQETTTKELKRYTENGNNGYGEYLFENVEIKYLENYYIEFEYDGLTYTNVTPHIDKNNGSKAAEIESDRTTFNENFSVVEGKTENTGYTRDAKGNQKYDLTYEKSGREATLISDGDYEFVKDNDGKNLYVKQNKVGDYKITANTDTTQYNIKSHYVVGQDEIRYINLGLVEREQPDLRLQKDLHNVKVSVNGYDNIYLYNSYYTNLIKEENTNVGVEWGYNDLLDGKVSYKRAIYRSDYQDTNLNGTDKELKVYITYELKMENQSGNLISQINSITDYYDSRYIDTIKVGTNVDDKKGSVSGGDIKISEPETYNDGYKKITISNLGEAGKIEGTASDKGNSKSIYVQFELTREDVADILHEKNVGEAADELLENVAEINSYSTYDSEGKVYAGVDKDSNPGNAKPGNKNEYEDDTFACPALQLEVAEDRKMTGTVFLDSTSGELKTGEIRQGDGKYTEGETTIAGVKVTLHENNGAIEDKTFEATGKDGNFEFTNYIPGEYTVTYTWGDETYTVQDYKGTIYNTSRDQTNKEWYKEEVETRYTDAIDNYNTDQEAPKGSRKQIDAETAIASNTTITRTKMDSTTPTMGITVENVASSEENTTTTDEKNGTTWKHEIKNIDFGIVERARQILEVSKDVTAIKITLANGQVIVNAQVVEDASGKKKLQGDALQGVTYGDATNISKGFIRSEIDNELIQGATIQIEYTIKVANKSELDYNSEEFYKYGTVKGDKITIVPTGVYDYLDNEMVLDDSKDNGNWKIVSKEDYQSTYPSKTMVEDYFEEGKSTETYTWNTSQTRYQSIFTEWASEVTEERTLRDNKLENKTILRNADLEAEIEPGKENTVNLYTSKLLTNTDEIDLNNDLEVTEMKRKKETGRKLDVKTSYVYDQGERVTVTPPTGDDQNYLPYVIIGITSFVILAAGIVIIKRKAI